MKNYWAVQLDLGGVSITPGVVLAMAAEQNLILMLILFTATVRGKPAHHNHLFNWSITVLRL